MKTFSHYLVLFSLSLQGLPMLAQVNVTTLAGIRTQGDADGQGTSAQFSGPTGMVIDAAGNLYVADSTFHRIRKVAPDGTVTTLAGSSAGSDFGGYVDGPGTSAKFDHPTNVAVDAAGNVYVADQFNSRIRKVTPDKTVTTLAGISYGGYADGPKDSAQLYWPSGVAVDASGNIFVADLGNNRIRKVAPDGTVSTFAGSGPCCGNYGGYADGPGNTAMFNGPSDIELDAVGNLYVIDYYNHRIRKVAPDGTVSTLAGSGVLGFADGPGDSAMFFYPSGLAVDGAGNTYVADNGNNRIRKVAQDGSVITLAGSGSCCDTFRAKGGFANGPGGAVRFNKPTDLAIDATGNIYVTDFGNYCIRKITQGASGVVPATTNAALSAWPNPTSGRLMVRAADNTFAKLQLIDLMGRSALESDFSGGSTEVDLSHLPPGLYLLRVEQGTSTANLRVVKH